MSDQADRLRQLVEARRSAPALMATADDQRKAIAEATLLRRRLPPERNLGGGFLKVLAARWPLSFVVSRHRSSA